jgi:Big-like domain-containing protein
MWPDAEAKGQYLNTENFSSHPVRIYTPCEPGLVCSTNGAHGVLRPTSSPFFKWRSFVAMLAVILSSSVAWATTNLFTASGTWTCPASVTIVTVECWGGGGAGGSAQTTSSGTASTSTAGGGGAGGAYAKKASISVTSGNGYTVTVGAAGIAPALPPTDGAHGDGGDSWFSSTSTVLAKGGGGGISKNAARPAQGAKGTCPSGSVGDVINLGGSGADGNGASGTQASGGGGGSGGTSTSGNNGGSPNVQSAATAVSGGGVGGAGAQGSSAVGSSGGSPSGGGGGGLASANSTGELGGNGSGGKVLLTYQATYYSKGSLDPGLTSSWTTARDGSGSNPSDFTTGDTFVIQNGHTMATTATWTISGSGSKLEIENGGVLTANNVVSISGSTTFQVDGGGKYRHAQNGGTIPTATWAATSTCEIAGVTSTVPGGLSQSFGNFTWNCSGQTADRDLAGALGGGSTKTINGSLTLQSANGHVLILNSSSGSSSELDVGGDVVVNADTLNLTSQNASGVIAIKVKGNVTVAASATLTVTGTQAGSNGIDFHFNGSANQTLTISGTFGAATKVGWTVDNGATVTLASGLTVTTGTAGPTGTGGFVTVANGGILDCGTQIIGGSGVFTLSSGGTLRIGSTAGITSSGTTGNIQVTGTGSARNFNTPASYTYNGTASQAVGNGLPATVNNLTIANTGSGGNNTVTLAQNTAVNGTLSITSGTLNLNGNTVTGSATVASGGTLDGVGTLTGAMTVNSGGTVSPGVSSIGTITLNSAPSLSGTNAMEINRAASPNADEIVLSSGTLTYGGTLTVNNAGAALQNGDMFTLFNASSYGGAFTGLTLQNWTDNTKRVNLSQLTVNGSISIGANTAPTANSLTLGAISNAPATFPLAKYASDPDGDFLTVSFNTFNHGGSAAYANGTVTYTPANGFTGTETFNYVVTDPSGLSASGTVTATVSAVTGGGANILSLTYNSGTATIVFVGIPGATYQLQASTDLVNWTQVNSNITLPVSGQPSAGKATVQQSSAPPSAFYRTLYISGP